MSSGLFRVTHTRDDGAMPDDEVRRARPNVSAGPTGPPQRGRPATRPLTCRWHGYCGAWLCSRTRDPVPPDAASLVRADRGLQSRFSARRVSYGVTRPYGLQQPNRYHHTAGSRSQATLTRMAQATTTPTTRRRAMGSPGRQVGRALPRRAAIKTKRQRAARPTMTTIGPTSISVVGSRPSWTARASPTRPRLRAFAPS